MNLNDVIIEPFYNSLTKYPSILTYHKMNTKGLLLDEKSFETDRNFNVYLTEKIDGENLRILAMNDDYIIGNRNELLYAKGDRICAGKKNIIDFLKESFIPSIETSTIFERDTLYCIYGELYGGRIQKASKNYTKDSKHFGFRIFDVWCSSKKDIQLLFEKSGSSSEVASNWREGNNQPWFTCDDLDSFAKSLNIELVPYLKINGINEIPNSLKDTYKFLCAYDKTMAAVDANLIGSALSEGVVIRSFDRTYISKLRFQDYTDTFRRTTLPEHRR